MARRTNFNGSQKPIVALTAQTLTWTPAEIPSERVVGFHITLQGAGNNFSFVSRIRVSANGQNIFNVTPAQLRQYLQCFSRGLLKYASTTQTLTIPFCLLDAPTPDQADICQFPTRSQCQVELVLLSTIPVAGVAVLGWTETTIQPVFYPRLLASTLNIPANTSLQRYNFQENGIVRGIQIPHAGVDRAKYTLGGFDYTFLPGAQFSALANIGDVLFEAESLYGDGPGGAGTPLTDGFSRITAGIPAPIDGSYIELQTGGGWAGVGNEGCIYAIAANDAVTKAQPAAA